MQTKIFVTKLLQEMRPDVLPLTPEQSDRVVNELVRHSLSQRSRTKTMLINFFDSQGVVPDGKTVNAEFYKGVMDHLLRHIQ
jgi:hypothetical protein